MSKEKFEEKITNSIQGILRLTILVNYLGMLLLLIVADSYYLEKMFVVVIVGYLL